MIHKHRYWWQIATGECQRLLPPRITRCIMRIMCQTHAARGASCEAALRCAMGGPSFDGCLTVSGGILVLGASGSSSNSLASSFDSSGASAGTGSACRADASWKGLKKSPLQEAHAGSPLKWCKSSSSSTSSNLILSCICRRLSSPQSSQRWAVGVRAGLTDTPD